MELIITLKGIGGCGKSTTLKKLCKKLEENENENYNLELDLSTIENKFDRIIYLEDDDKKDYAKIYSIKKDESVEIKIGICTFGDIGEELKKVIEEFVSRDCEIIIVATRTYGETVKTVFSYGVDIIECGKTTSKNENLYNFCNIEDVNRIYEILKNYINKYC